MRMSRKSSTKMKTRNHRWGNNSKMKKLRKMMMHSLMKWESIMKKMIIKIMLLINKMKNMKTNKFKIIIKMKKKVTRLKSIKI